MKRIEISDVKIQGDKCKAHVLLNGAKDMQRKFLVNLVKESGTWKVDKVQGRD